MPKPQRKLGFSDRFDEKRQSDLFLLIINEISQEGYMYPSVVTLCDSCRTMITAPTLACLKTILQFDCHSAADAKEFYLLVQLQALFKKRSDLELGVDKQRVALDAFLRSETMCRETNRKLRSSDDPRSGDRAALIHMMQRKISEVLGDLPPFDDLACGFGPGTNIGCSKNTSVRHKLNSDVTTTEGAGRYFLTSTHTFHAWVGLSKPRLVRGSRWTSVPKTSLTDRGINVEPILNSFIQKGIGAAIRNRLKRVGIDLNDQTPNQEFARKGSLRGLLATIDLSMASDTVSYLLVMDLLPHDWFIALDACRSPQCTLPDGSVRILEKFSSMGNGATFELESLIFYSLLWCVCCKDEERTISVYGDDLICPCDMYDEVLDALSLLGFVPNDEKSFGSGPFRESCGKDYWNGTNVRPVMVKELLSTKEIYRLYNFFKRTGWLPHLPGKLLSAVPKQDRHFGPDGYGDGHLIWDSAPRPKIDKRGWEPFHVITTWQAKPRTVKSPLSSDYGAFLFLRDRSLEPDECFTALQTVHACLQDIPPEKWVLPVNVYGYVFEQAERSSEPRYCTKRIRVPVAH